MIRLWKFISQPRTLAVLIALGGVIAFLWNKVEPQAKADHKNDPAASTGFQMSTATGGAAVNASGGAQVTIGPGPSQAVLPPPAAPVPAPRQVARAQGGGAAVNAADQTRVRIDTER